MSVRQNVGWTGVVATDPISYLCGYCGMGVASSLGCHAGSGERILICPACWKPTYLYGHELVPQALFGSSVEHTPKHVEAAYEEARRCYSVAAYTAAVMLCRKLLMNIAVEKGATEGESFAGYVKFLEAKHYMPPNSKTWVDKIRGLGNEANHKLEVKSKADAELGITFCEMLLKFLYEYAELAKP